MPDSDSTSELTIDVAPEVAQYAVLPPGRAHERYWSDRGRRLSEEGKDDTLFSELFELGRIVGKMIQLQEGGFPPSEGIPRPLSDGSPSTLETYIEYSRALWGEESPQTRFLEQKAQDSPNGASERVVAEEGQMLRLLVSLSKEPE